MTTRTTTRRGPHPRCLPTGMAERLRWLAAVGHENNEAVVCTALATLRDQTAPDEERNAAVATLWRALKPLIESTAIKVTRAAGPGLDGQALVELDTIVVNLLLRTRAENRAQFVVFAQRWLAHAAGRVFQSLKGPVAMTEHHAETIAGGVASPEADEIERVLIDTINAVTPTAKHITILEHFFGLNAFRGRANPNQSELAEIYGLSRPRIGQLIDRVRDRLRAVVDGDAPTA